MDPVTAAYLTESIYFTSRLTMSVKTVIVTAPINIALTKYWGKEDEFNIYPLNNSISLTLSQDQVRPFDHLYFIEKLMTTTKITTGPHLTKSSFSLNGILQKEIPSRTKDVIILCLLRARLSNRCPVYRHVYIESTNNFPTAAGLASSASGMAALAFGLAKLYELDSDITEIARRGSGSSCRSMKGGIVQWIRCPLNETQEQLTRKSFAKQLYPCTFWPELRVAICVTSAAMKPVGSTLAMQRTVHTSSLFAHGRISSVQINEEKLLLALKNKDFSSLGTVIMKESNQLHALCLDAWPPCVYLNEFSLALIRWVHGINKYFGRLLVAYTFDAGPNCFLIAEAKDMPVLQHLLVASFGSVGPDTNPAGDDMVTVDADGSRRSLILRGIRYPASSDPTDSQLLDSLPRLDGAISFVISCEIGDGPILVSRSSC
ncbi:Diphosphomevalonate decarboxylase [Fasciola hepatica]|uniref:Diphosphomevalonate decarboxylase n=1 Tax=Fasciola hepatica TaxID=6192 RepID=A0A4E0R4G3_FASHE|nr:Diphosphomevalonate decarboxylase [Fasciola hepatica]